MSTFMKVVKTILLLISGLAIIIIGQLLGEITYSVVPIPSLPDIVYIIVAVLAVLAMNRWVLKIPLEEFGLGKLHLNWWWVVLGLAMPWALNFTMAMIFAGNITFNPNTSFMTIYMAVIAAFSAGMVEELIFRSYMFSTIRRDFGLIAATIIPSVFFAATHLLNGSLNFTSTIMLLVAGTIVGVTFTLIRLATGNIWTAVIMHTLWDTFVADSNIANENALVAIKDATANPGMLLSGGQYGIETSLPGMLVFAIPMIIIFVSLKNRGMIGTNNLK